MSYADAREVYTTKLQSFPLTNFIAALYKMTPEQRMKASAEKAAERYGLDVRLTGWWIIEAQKTQEQWPMRRQR